LKLFLTRSSRIISAPKSRRSSQVERWFPLMAQWRGVFFSSFFQSTKKGYFDRIEASSSSSPFKARSWIYFKLDLELISILTWSIDSNNSSHFLIRSLSPPIFTNIHQIHLKPFNPSKSFSYFSNNLSRS